MINFEFINSDIKKFTFINHFIGYTNFSLHCCMKTKSVEQTTCKYTSSKVKHANYIVYMYKLLTDQII